MVLFGFLILWDNFDYLKNDCTEFISKKILEHSARDLQNEFLSIITAENPNVDMVEFLIERGGCKADLYDENGISLIMRLASKPRSETDQTALCEIAQILIMKGAELDVVGGEDNLVPFEMAERAGNLGLAEYLKERTLLPQF